MNEQKKNDWLATLFFSPEKTTRDLANLGINTSNSELKDIDYYKNIPQIQESFKKEDGSFDNNKFTKYYQEALRLYNEADNEKFISDITEYYTYDSEDIFAPSESKRKNNGATLTITQNLGRQGQGAKNLKQTSAPTMSFREVGQQNLVFNWDTQKFEDWTPNDWGGLKAVTRPTLVLAAWDDDGEHNVNGRIVSHKKGDLKFNEYGDTYYETLGNRSVAGKDILHISDTLTVDGSRLNNYDFFDSDGLDKSVIGTISKTLFRVAPMFIPYVNKIYGGLYAAKELGKLIPVLFKSIESIAMGDTSNSKSTQVANNIQGWFSRFDSSTSDYGQSGFFTFENIGQLIADSSGQLWQQRVIGMLPAKISALRHAGMISDNAKKWGQGMSLAYMAGTSSIDAYDSFKEAGASDRVAGLGMIAVAGAMFGLMNQDYFKDMWFKGTYLDRTKVRDTIKEAAKDIEIKEFNTFVTKEAEKNTKEAAKWVLKTKNYLLNKWNSMSPGDLAYDALNEGIEETMEEVSTDIVKGLFSGLNTLGLIDKNQSLDFGITPFNATERYFTSFVGGSIGGAVFSLHNKVEGFNSKQTNKIISDDGEGLQELIYLIRNGKTDDIYEELNLLYNKGKLGSTNLSGTETESIRTENSTTIQYKSAVEGNSQNDIIYKQLTDYINRINSIINEENLGFSDNELVSIALLAKKTGLSPEEVHNNLLMIDQDQRFEQIRSLLIDKQLYSQIFEDWNSLSNEIIKTKAALESMLTPSSTEPKTPKDIEVKIETVQKSSEYQKLKLKLDQLRIERDAILNGNKNDFYMSQLLFASNPEIAKSFVPKFGIHNYTRYKYNKEYEDLTVEEAETVNNEFDRYTNLQEKKDIVDAHNLFYKFQEDISQPILEASSKTIDSSNVYMLESSEFTQRYDTITDKINKTQTALDEAVNKLHDQETSEEVETLRQELVTLQNDLNNLVNNHHIVLQPALSVEGKKILERPQDNTIESINNYNKSYLNFLDYIKNNNLYLSLIDADLTSIFDNWLVINGLKEDAEKAITLKVQEYFGISEDVSEVVDQILDIINAIKSNDLSKILKAYDEALKGSLLDIIINYGDDDDVNSLLEYVLPSFGEYKFIDYINLINDKKRDIKSSSAIDLIEKAFNITGLSSNDIINTIKKEQKDFINSKGIEDYMIRDKESLNKLKETDHMIDILSSAINTSLEGSYNSKINVFRDNLGKELLSEIPSDIALSMLRDLSNIKLQINTLIKISEENLQQKLNEQKEITFNMRRKFVDCLTNNESLIVKTFIDKFNIDTIKLAEQFFTEPSYDYKNYDKYEQAAIEFETALFNEVEKLELSNNNLATILISCFNPKDLIDAAPTKLNKDKNTVVTGYDQLLYIASILSKPSRNFYNDIKKIISDKEYKLAPLFSQEYAVRIADASIVNRDLFNNIVWQISELTKDLEDVYLKTKTPLYNIATIFGGAGVGKTTGVASLLQKLHPDANIILSAPEQKQVDNLEKILGKNDNKFTKNQLIEKILGNPLNSNDIVEIKHNDVVVSIQSKLTLNVNTHNIFGDAKEKLLFIDEISLYDRPELEIISKWAKKNNISVICLGDYKQNESSRIVNNKSRSSGISDCFIIKTPDLIAPLRPDNIAKYDNYIKLSVALSGAYDYYYQDTSRSIQMISTWVENYLKVNNIEFKYYETDSSFGGEKIVNTTEIKLYIDKLKKLSNDIVIITDHPERYIDTNVKVIDPSQVQGAEFDYIIIDKVWDPSRYMMLKDLYTLTQRSRKGSIINNIGLSKEILSQLDQSSVGNIELSQSQINDFKEWRLKSLENLPTEPIIYTPKVDLISEQTTPSEKLEVQTESKLDNTSKLESITENKFEAEAIPVIDNIKENTSTDEITPSNDVITPIEKSIKINDDIINPENNDYVNDNINTPSHISFISEKVTEAKEVLKLYEPELFTQYLNSSNSISKHLSEPNINITRRIIYLLASYYLSGYYKIDTEENNRIHNKIINELSSTVNEYVGDKYYELINEILENDFEFHIIPFNKKGLLVSRINYKNIILDIPLFITDPVIGKYDGDIEISSEVKRVYNRNGINTVDINNFKLSTINPYMLYKSRSKPIILSVEKSEINDYTDDQKDFIVTKRNNGNTFLLVSTNPFITEQDFNRFLTPIENDGKYIFTTQHNNSIGIIGVNWTADFNKFLSYSKSLLNSNIKDSIITGSRVGTILAIAYNIIPNYINNAVEYYFSNKNHAVAVNNKICNTYEEYLLAVNQGNLKSISFHRFINRKWEYDKGEFTLNRIFYNKDGSLKVDDNILNRINIACSKSPLFPLGIYGRDIRGNHINGNWYNIKEGLNDVSYITNTNLIVGNDYKIDISKINRMPSDINNDKILAKLNDTLNKLGFNKIITNMDNIQSVLDSINIETLKNLSSPEFTILTFNDTDIITEKQLDYKAFAESKLKTTIDEFNIKYSNKFIPFLVSLQNQQIGYVIEQNNNDYNIREFPLVAEYNKLLDYLHENNDIINSNKSLKNYLQKLMINEEIDLQTAEDYYNIVQNFKDLQHHVNNYLIAKLQTYEC